jgi:hypothetical protein
MKFRMTEWKFMKGLNFYLSCLEKVSRNGYDFRIGWDFRAPYKFYDILRIWGWDFGKSRDLKYHLFWKSHPFSWKMAEFHTNGYNASHLFLMSVSDACFPPLHLHSDKKRGPPQQNQRTMHAWAGWWLVWQLSTTDIAIKLDLVGEFQFHECYKYKLTSSQTSAALTTDCDLIREWVRAAGECWWWAPKVEWVGNKEKAIVRHEAVMGRDL